MKVFIGCSSKENLEKEYIDATIEIANYLASHHYHLMIGGTDGLMKILNTIFTNHKLNRTIMSVAGYYEPLEIEAVNQRKHQTIAERKTTMIKEADLFLFLPGGIGTLDELFTMLESKRAREHDKPILILNINHYYDDVIKQLYKMEQKHFITSEDKKYYDIADSVSQAIQYIEQLGDQNEQ